MNPTRTQRRQDGSARLALGVVIGWIALEVLGRWGGVVVVGSAIGSVAAADWLFLLVGFPVVAALLTAFARRYGSSVDRWGYDFSRCAILAGALAIVVGIVLTWATGRIDSVLFGLESAGDAFGQAATDAFRGAPLLAAVFVLGNGIVVPIAEEHVWRGIVQSELVAAWGAAVGVLVTAVAFALKHVVVDLAVFRVTTLLGLGLLFGLVRHRYGTGSSIVVHVGLNLLSSIALVSVAFTA